VLTAELRLDVQEFYSRYAECLDGGRLQVWPEPHSAMREQLSKTRDESASFGHVWALHEAVGVRASAGQSRDSKHLPAADSLAINTYLRYKDCNEDDRVVGVRTSISGRQH
jgi:hypothetical protein